MEKESDLEKKRPNIDLLDSDDYKRVSCLSIPKLSLQINFLLLVSTFLLLLENISLNFSFISFPSSPVYNPKWILGQKECLGANLPD